MNLPGHILPLRTPASTLKSLTDLLNTAEKLIVGLNNSLVNRYARSTDPLSAELVTAWTKSY